MSHKQKCMAVYKDLFLHGVYLKICIVKVGQIEIAVSNLVDG